MRSNFNMVVMNTDIVAKRNHNPLAYIDNEIEDTLESVRDFFENASIEVDHMTVKRIAKDLDSNGYSYFGKFLFTLV